MEPVTTPIYPIRSFHRDTTVDHVDVESLIQALKLSGAIILRNLAIDQNEFIKLMRRIAPGSIRGVVPSESSLEFHGELYYTPKPPDILWFYCVEPPTVGGETLLTDGVAIANDMKPETMRWFIENPLVYRRVFTPEQWKYLKDLFIAEGPDAASNRLTLHTAVIGKFQGELLHTRFKTYAIRRTKWGDEAAFVNSLPHALDSRHRSDIGDYGLATSIPHEIVSEIQGLTWKYAFPIQWRKGDIALIDNTRVMHARRAFTGRRVIVAVNGKALF